MPYVAIYELKFDGISSMSGSCKAGSFKQPEPERLDVPGKYVWCGNKFSTCLGVRGTWFFFINMVSKEVTSQQLLHL